MSGDNILVDIFNALDRLEAGLKGQAARLGTIELSVRSGPASPTSGGSFAGDAMLGPARDKQLPGLPDHAPLTPPPSSQAESPVSMYETSITRLRRRFEFVDDSRSDIYDAPEWPSGDRLEGRGRVPGPSTPWHRSAEAGDSPADNDDDDDDAYTRSAYSPRPLSRLDLQIPPVPAVPETAQLRQGRQHYSGTPGRDYASLPAAPAGHAEDETRPVRPFSRSQSRRRSWGSSSSKSRSPGQQSHKRVEMTYYAYENFGESLRSSMSFRSEERRAARDEIRRLEALATPAAKEAPSTLSNERKGHWASALRGLFLRRFSTTKLQRPERIYFVA